MTETVEEIARWLPAQGPLKEFVHHNTLHAYQDREFYAGCLTASRMYAARAFLPLSEYRSYFQSRRIDDQGLRSVLLEQSDSELEISRLRDRMLNAQLPDETLPRGVAKEGLRSRWRERHGLALKLHSHPQVFRILSQFLDQGVSIWRMPHTQVPLYEAVLRIVEESWVPLEPFSSQSSRRFLKMEPARAILEILTRFVGNEKYFGRYLLEMSLAHPGWSGMVRMVETQPHSLVLQRKVSLLEFCALELIAEYAAVCGKLGENFQPLLAPGEELPPLPVESDYRLEPTETEQLQMLWHEAYERTYIYRVLREVSGHQAQGAILDPEVQAFFCIDDRECALLRHLERTEPTIQAFTWAGFFGVDCVFKGSHDAFPFKHCPVPVNPRHLIRESTPAQKVAPRSWWSKLFHFGHSADSNTLLRGFLITQTLGLGAAFRLALSIFHPTMSPLHSSSLLRLEQEGELQIERTSDELEDGYIVGYSPAEMADRVYQLLRATGASRRPLAELIVLFGHGASSVNNTYFAAYDCGACSGKPGAPNARAFALMTNRPDVRKLVRERGIDIKDSTWFVGALHDTTRDEVQYYEVDKIPPALRAKFAKFQKDMLKALGANAQERCRDFALVDPAVSPEQALLEVRRRSTAIFEPRPELNHSNNSGAIVGRRGLTRGIDFQRRLFLNSYDPELDPTGEILANILTAVVPVCGGINLEYYFSRLDCRVYGAGSKLPHNVNGLIAVVNGIEGDLLTGLPSQMTEVHEPVRLFLLVQQTPETALAAARKFPGVYQWVENGWVRYFSITPGSFELHEYKNGTMQPMQLIGCPGPIVPVADVGAAPLETQGVAGGKSRASTS
ncbi:MAG: DUF2309 domain-containing protein [Candidatus Eremiobacteraeota bacterium]|nr:DUF2309 domain-containing protein [Candidatus Eremiobacteraeota bacterium]MCW5871261.1 DUF2309 domain-containing protein [Candidatus Eremiobacteraeota bacterium]